MTHAKTAQNYMNVKYSCVPNYFYFVLSLRSVGRSAKTYECSILNIFSSLGPSLPIFRHVMESLLLELHKMIKMPIVFILIFGQGRQGGVLKLMKNDLFFSF